MRTHVDWLTFTLAPQWVSVIPEGGFEDAYINALMDAFLITFPQETVIAAFSGVWQKRERSRAPYTDAWDLGKKGMTVFASPDLKHFCVEISGSGCEALIADGVLQDVLAAVHERVTRIDIATDIETDVKPSEFAAKRLHVRMRASGYQISETGETSYVGSQKSDRYARVYRYNPPHPRSHLLRIEHVFRRENAKVVARECAVNEVERVAVSAGRAIGWAHECWQPTVFDPVDISVISGGREVGKTVFWLVNSVAPAFKRLCETGGITDPEAFLTRYFLPED